MSKSSKHPYLGKVVNATLVLLAFGLLGGVIWQNREEIREVLGRRLDFRVLGLAFAIYMAGQLLTFARWFFLVRVIEPKFRFRDAILLGYIGNVFNLVIPGAVGGDFIKAAYLVRMRINKTQAIASMVLDRILGLMGLFLLAGISGAVAWPLAGTVVRRLIVVVWAFLGLSVLGLLAIFGQALTRRFPQLLEGHGRIALLLRELAALSKTYRSKPGLVVGALTLASINHALSVVAFYLVSTTIFPASQLPSLGQHFLMVPLTLFTTAVPIPFGALGLTERVSKQLFQLVDHPHGDLAMMGFRVLMYAGALVSACFYLANLKQVRGLSDTAGHLEEELIEGEFDPEEPAEGDGVDGPAPAAY
jgi:uncharacterized protein (TIRG00374 family)